MDLTGANEIPWPKALRFAVMEDPPADLRAALGRQIHAFHSQSTPYDGRRFAMLLHDTGASMVAGICGSMSWGWLFVEAVWVADQWRSQGIGRRLVIKAEAHARDNACHSAWLDTFRAQDFYLRLGYQSFAVLEDYPAEQSRMFFRKRLAP